MSKFPDQSKYNQIDINRISMNNGHYIFKVYKKHEARV